MLAGKPSKILVPFLILYALMVYFRAATASLHDEYLPDIEAIRWSVSPGLLLFLLAASALITKSGTVSGLAFRASVGGALICLLILVGVPLYSTIFVPPGSGWLPRESRSLQVVLEKAMLAPSFSNRSYGYLVGCIIVAAFSAWLSWLAIRKPTANHSLKADGADAPPP